MMMASQDRQFVLGFLHEMGIGEGHNRVQTLGQVVGVFPDDPLGWIRVHHNYQQAGIVVF